MRVNSLALFCFIPFFLGAQQWRPVNSTEKFNFRIDSADIITHVICVDSADLLNTDSIFYFNRVVRKCTGCLDPDYYLCNQPQFLLKEMIMQPGGVFLFKGPGSFLLKTLSGLNESWIFDTAAGINAQVTANSAEQVFGQWDSVKTISLSNGRQIRLSKDHGILQFPVMGQNYFYLLEGIAGRNAGTLLPGFMDFFNYQVGDVFQYKYEWMSYAMGWGGTTLLKERILSRDSTPGGYAYEIEKCEMWWNMSINWIPGPVSHQYQVVTCNFDDSVNHVCNYYPGQLVMNPLGPGYPEDFASVMTVFRDTGQTISRKVGPPGNFLFYHEGTDTLVPVSFDTFYNEYTTGLGEVAYIENGFELFTHNRLIGYVKNGDTTGIIHPDDYILENVKPDAASNDLIVFPNPASDRVFIRLPENCRKFVCVELVGPGGEVMQRLTEQDAPATITLDISGMIPGLYILLVRTPGNLVSRKIIIQ